jgi:hypothetical protein
MHCCRRSREDPLCEKGCAPMKRPDSDSERTIGKSAFAENRYRKYQFQRECIMREAPEASGVYGLYSALWIYIGDAENIRARLLKHLAGDNSCINHHQPSGFAFEVVSPEDRSRRRAQLVSELEPPCKEERSHIAPVREAGSVADVTSIDGTSLSGEPKLRGETDE